MGAVGEVSRIDGRSHWVLAADRDRALELGPMEAADGLLLALHDRVALVDLPGGRWVIVARLPAGD